MHPAAAEPGHLARREQARHRPGPLARGHRTPGRDAAEHPAGQVGLQAAQRLAGQDVEPHSDQRPGLRVQNLVRRRGAGQPLATGPAGVPDRHDLQVLGERIIDLAVARDDLPFQVGQLQKRLWGQLVHPRHELGQRPGHHEVGPVPLERLHRAGRPAAPGTG